MTRADPRASYRRRFDEISGELPGSSLPWLSSLRREAIDHFAERGFPTRRDEDWRYTDVSALDAVKFERARAQVTCGGAATGVRVSSLRELLAEAGPAPESLARHLGRLADSKSHPFVALNTALFEDGLLIEIEPGAALAEPVEIRIAPLASAAPVQTHVRVLVLAGAGSRATLIERYQGQETYFQNAVSELVLERDAELTHVRVQRESPGAFHFASLVAEQGEASRFASHSIALGGRLARADIRANLAAEGAVCRLYGLYLGAAGQLLDHHTWIDHALPRTESRELYKGILAGRARGVFRGRIHVRPDAQKIDAQQTNRNLLLSDEAVANTRPQLEIYANDVRCSHGASVGRLDDDALFYLRSRGVGPEEARGLLTLGFAREVIDALPTPALRDEIEAALLDWLPRASAPPEGTDAGRRRG